MRREKQPDRLAGFVDRLVQLADERAGLAEDAKEILIEADRAGFNKQAVRQIVKEKRLDRAAFLAHKSTWDTV